MTKTDWHSEGIKELENLGDMVRTHIKNKTRPTHAGMVALEMLINSIIKSVRCNPVLTTKELCDELCKRDGVRPFIIKSNEQYTVTKYCDNGEKETNVGNGTTRILVIKEGVMK